ncbi:PREDICTED: homeobox-leucine zipper protein HAT22-like isoform X1 [Camelina sativa]|uniref:Homeobox-leucine zipper protein HAT22-like isoform X1 n=1 Tax=Camelina sativa TaxID=90675 RepID=A0ABM0TVD6_CAMSA|nr:PREDICTED: homeobox-leucine zipper protein HAT22-like isoform X1 [Camelina sativa]
MGFDDSCNTGLVLGLSLSPASSNYNHAIKKASATVDHRFIRLDPSLTLSLSGESYKTKTVAGAGDQICRQTSSHSGISSFSSGRVKREREISGGDGEEEAEETTERVVSSRVSDDHEDEEGVSARKKLRLTKQQSALLEDSFKLHSTLNPKQKQTLARQLNLRPRQVEVWFQNRRARTKLKQTEVDCEFLKKCCETLTDENRRLQKELQDLKALKLAQPFYMHMPAATLTMCPSCERLGGGGGTGGAGGGTAAVDGETAKGAFSIVTKPRFYNPFTNPSAAC